MCKKKDVLWDQTVINILLLSIMFPSSLYCTLLSVRPIYPIRSDLFLNLNKSLSFFVNKSCDEDNFECKNALSLFPY